MDHYRNIKISKGHIEKVKPQVLRSSNEKIAIVLTHGRCFIQTVRAVVQDQPLSGFDEHYFQSLFYYFLFLSFKLSSIAILTNSANFDVPKEVFL